MTINARGVTLVALDRLTMISISRWTPAIALVLMAVVPHLQAGDPPPKPEENGKKTTIEKASDGDGKDEADKKKKEKKPDRYFAVTGGVVHTISDGVRTGVTILTKNGRIADIGPSVELPKDCEILDASGYHVYPGLVAVASGSVLGSEPPDDTTNVYSLGMAIGLAGGITTAITGNTAGKLTFGTTEDMVVRRKVFETLSYSTSEPDGRRRLRADLEKVRQYIRDLERYEDAKARDPELEEPDKEWIKGKYETYLKLLRGEALARFNAERGDDILAVCELAERYGLRGVVYGATEGWTVASRMARAGLSAVITPRRSVNRNERLNRPNGSSIENAAILHAHGVPVAVTPPMSGITLWGLAGRDLLQLNMDAAFAIRGGLPGDAALEAITIGAARILGVDHRVGSIEVGKDADFAITDGDLLHYMTTTRWTVVNGRIAYDKQKDSLFSHIRPGGDQDAPAPDDYWPRRLGAGL